MSDIEFHNFMIYLTCFVFVFCMLFYILFCVRHAISDWIKEWVRIQRVKKGIFLTTTEENFRFKTEMDARVNLKRMLKIKRIEYYSIYHSPSEEHKGKPWNLSITCLE